MPPQSAVIKSVRLLQTRLNDSTEAAAAAGVVFSDVDRSHDQVADAMRPRRGRRQHRRPRRHLTRVAAVDVDVLGDVVIHVSRVVLARRRRLVEVRVDDEVVSVAAGYAFGVGRFAATAAAQVAGFLLPPY